MMRTIISAISLSVIALFISCTQQNQPAQQQTKPEPEVAIESSGTIGEISLYKKYKEFFTMGAAVSPYHIDHNAELLAFHFNRLTVEDDMKLGKILISPNSYTWTNSDKIANFARKNDMKMTGHALIWHKQQPFWLFKGLSEGNPDDIEQLKSRMKKHIFKMVERYGDVIDNWDVVNEAISETAGKIYRDADEGSDWYRVFQSEDYIYWAFVYADMANKKYGRKAKLFYNDYNLANPQKREKTIAMLKWLIDKGAPIDGVGLQAHWNLNHPSTAEIQRSIDEYSNLGLLIKISELDVSIYTNDDWVNSMWEDQKVYTAEVSAQQATRYKELFELFRKNSSRIENVTLWGASDETSWLNYYPLMRKNYPLLFDKKNFAKEAYFEVVDF
jgi:endo-1,4-beta-xylanase